jgi:hypothetical protein
VVGRAWAALRTQCGTPLSEGAIPIAATMVLLLDAEAGER